MFPVVNCFERGNETMKSGLFSSSHDNTLANDPKMSAPDFIANSTSMSQSNDSYSSQVQFENPQALFHTRAPVQINLSFSNESVSSKSSSGAVCDIAMSIANEKIITQKNNSIGNNCSNHLACVEDYPTDLTVVKKPDTEQIQGAERKKMNTTNLSASNSPVNCINSNPTLAAMLEFRNTPSNINYQNVQKSSSPLYLTPPRSITRPETAATSATATPTTGNGSTQYQNVRLNPEMNIRDFLSDSSNYSLSPTTNVTNDMLSNYDKSKHTTIPMDTVGVSMTGSGSTLQQNPFTILGYNILSVNVPQGSSAMSINLNAPQASYPTSYYQNYIQPHPDSQMRHDTFNTSQFQLQPQQFQHFQTQQEATSVSALPSSSLSLKSMECHKTLQPISSSKESPNKDDSGNGFILKHSGSYTCSMCKGRFYTKEYLEYHLFVKHNIRFVDQSASNTCIYSTLPLEPALQGQNMSVNAFESIQKMDAMRSVFHRKPQSGGSSTLSHGNGQTFYCTLCPKTYTYQRNLRKHELSVHEASSHEGIQAKSVPKSKPNLKSKPMPTSTMSTSKTSQYAFPSLTSTYTASAYALAVANGGKVVPSIAVATNTNLKKSKGKFSSSVNSAPMSTSKPKSKQLRQQTLQPLQHVECRVCHEICVDQGALIIHMKQHVSTCPLCYKMFGSKRGLKLHSSVHVESHDKPYSCELCEKQYTHSRSLKHHMKRHTEVAAPVLEQQPQQQQQDQNQELKEAVLSNFDVNEKPITVYSIGSEGQDQNQTQIQSQSQSESENFGRNITSQEQSLMSDYLSFSFGTIEEATER